jgi:hypothetical protein
MSLQSTLLALCLLGSGLLIEPPSALGQAPASDSTAPVASDSQRTAADSLQKTDTTPPRPRPDSGSKTDTTHPPSAPSGTVGPSPQPRDSILTAACGGPGTVAQDLLVIVFGPEAGARERAAAAKSVDGKLLGPVGSGEPGGYYLRVPTGGNEFRLRLASDQLIQLPQVRQVGSRTCPPLPPPEKTR